MPPMVCSAHLSSRFRFKRFATFARLIVLLCAFLPFAAAQAAYEALAAGYGKLDYPLPEIGTYLLPAVGAAPDGQILRSVGSETTLHSVFDNKITLLNFMYSSCSDINGCPLSSHVFYKIKTAMQSDPELAQNLKLVSMSFDPERDSPEKMNLYSANFRFAGKAGSWDFLTTESESALQPILNAYGQDVQRNNSLQSNGTSDISHLLRVFLIDANNNIRNIYSVAFLHADILLNDVKTLLAERSNETSSLMLVTLSDKLLRAGDVKDGYESKAYQTDSVALDKREGEPVDLMRFVTNPPLGLPEVPVPVGKEITREKIALGRKLFYDRRLSINNTFSCAMCHVPEQGFTSNELATAVGVEGRSVRRNSSTLFNVAYATRLFHDGREENLEQQVWGPLLAKNEMANPSVGYILQKIRGLKDYKGLFEKAFDGKSVAMDTLGDAIASYERTLVSGNSPFDRWYFGKQEDAISESAKQGFSLFAGKAGCVVCHTVSQDSALFSDNAMHNTGLGYADSHGVSVGNKKVQLAPGVFVEIDSSIIESVGHPPVADVGLYEITEDPADRWKYKTPTLRNIAMTAPYMHNGEFSSLKEVVRFYNDGGVDNPLLDPAIRPLGLNDEEIDDLIEFMTSLNGDNISELVADAFAAPVGDTGFVSDE